MPTTDASGAMTPSLTSRRTPAREAAEAGGVADLDRGRHRVGDDRSKAIETVGEVVGERGGAGGLDCRQTRHAVDQTGVPEIGEGLAEGGGVAEIAAGERDDVRDLPVELLEHLEDDRLLSLQAEGIHRVHEVNRIGR